MPTLIDFLPAYTARERVSFHMPGHKGRRIFEESDLGDLIARLVDFDITEVPGADNLYQAEGVIKGVMDRYRNLSGSLASYLLVGGSSAGIMASLFYAAERGRIILSSDCHKSAMHALTLSRARCSYVDPLLVPDFGISGGADPRMIEQALLTHRDTAFVYLTSPNYYGIGTDIKKIADICHQRGVCLIVDQAHGAHLRLLQKAAQKEGGKRPWDRIEAGSAGADIVIESLHKTMASFTQTAVCHVFSPAIDRTRLEELLQIFQSSSPSYPLMLSCDMNAAIVERRGDELGTKWLRNLRSFREAMEKVPQVRVLTHPLLDPSKIDLDMSRIGLSGGGLFKELCRRGIVPELYTDTLVVCMTGIGSRDEDYRLLAQALEDISGAIEPATSSDDGGRPALMDEAALFHHGDISTVSERRERVPYKKAAGRVAAAALIPYPPGIALIVPGEIMTKEKLAYAVSLRRQGRRVIGLDEDDCVMCGPASYF